MKKNVLLVIASAIAFVLLFVFFSVRFKSPENAMVPPRPSTENQEILQAFQKSINKNTDYQLKYPLTGKYKNPFTFCDIDGDGKNEVLVFYTSEKSGTTTRVNILDHQNGQWVSVLDEEGYGMDVYSIDFEDLDGDKIPELLISWLVVPNTQSRTLTVQKVEIDASSHLQLRALLDQQYRSMAVTDMDGDSRNELLIIWSRNMEDASQTYASLFKMDKHSNLRSYGKKVALDNDVSGYSNWNFQQIQNHKVAFVDAYKGERGMITELVWWDKDRKNLVAPFSDNDSLTNSATYRSLRIPSLSIGNHSTKEIPLLVNNYEGELKKLKNGESLVPIVCWYSVKITGDDVQLIPQDYTLVNVNEQYILPVKPNMGKNLLGVREHTGTTTVYAFRSGKRTEPLFTIAYKMVRKSKNTSAKEDPYSFRIYHGRYTAFGKLTDVGLKYGFTNDFLEQNLKFY